MRELVIDWASCRTEAEFYDAVLAQMAAPSWHGRNLDALQDSWVVGRICESGPPFVYRFHGTPPRTGFASTVIRLARTSVRRHGGRVSIDARA